MNLIPTDNPAVLDHTCETDALPLFPGDSVRRRSRLPNRMHLGHRYIRHMRQNLWGLTLDQLVAVVYCGREVHSEQRRRLQELLDRYAEAGMLTPQPREDGRVMYLASHDPPRSPEQEALRKKLAGWMPHDVDFSKKSLLSVVGYVLDELS